MTKYNRRTARLRPMVESLETKQLLSSVADTVTGYLTNAVEAGGKAAVAKVGTVAIGYALSAIGLDSLSPNAQFNAIQNQLTNLTNQVAALSVSVNALSAKVDQSILNGVIGTIPINGLNTAWTQYQNLLNPSLSQAARKDSTDILLKLLGGLVNTSNPLLGSFETAFRGAGPGSTKLMDAYASAYFNNAALAPGKTVLTPAYSNALSEVFTYYKDLEAEALTLTVEYYNSVSTANGNAGYKEVKKSDGTVEYIQNRNPVALNDIEKIKKDTPGDLATVPKAVPTGTILNVKNNLFYATFGADTKTFTYAQATDYGKVLSGTSATQYQWVTNSTGPSLAFAEAGAKSAKTINQAVGGTLKWELPNIRGLELISVEPRIRANSAAWDASLGLQPQAVWTTETAVITSYKPLPGGGVYEVINRDNNYIQQVGFYNGTGEGSRNRAKDFANAIYLANIPNGGKATAYYRS
jgi:hypothetical protein